MPLSRVDIVGGLATTVSDLTSAPSTVINWETDAAGVIRPRAALASYSFTRPSGGAFTTGIVVGMYVWRDNLIAFTLADADPAGAASDGIVLSSGAPTIAIPLDPSTLSHDQAIRYTFVGAEEHVYWTGGEQITRWDGGLFPAGAEGLPLSPTCTHIASLGSYLIANDLSEPNSFRWSDIGEGSWDVWPAENITTASVRPDPVVALADTSGELYVWGNQSLQVYQVGVDPTLPFDLVASIERGIAGPYAYVRIDEQFCFLDDLRRIVISDGRSVEAISAAIEKDLRTLSTIEDAWAYRVSDPKGQRLVFRFPTEETTFVYDMDLKAWTTYKYYASPFQVDYPVSAYAYWPARNLHVLGSSLVAGDLFTLNEDTRQENGTIPIVCERVTGWHAHGPEPKRKRSLRLRVVLRRGISSTSTVSDQGQLEIRVQNEDASWAEWQSIPLGDASQYENTVDLFPGGIFKRRRYGIRYSSTEAAELAELYDEVTELDS